MADINEITAKGLQPLQPGKAKAKPAEAASPKGMAPREKDRVEITGQPKAVKKPESDVSVSPQKLKEYTDKAMKLPDIDEKKVAEVKKILEEHGYGPDVFGVMAARILDEGF